MALEKIKSKMEKIVQNAKTLKLDCIEAYCYDSTQAVSAHTHDYTAGNTSKLTLKTHCKPINNVLILYLCVFVDGPPFPEESFERILLDAPCSGLGQRPNMSCGWSLKEVRSYQPLQRKLFTTVRIIRFTERHSMDRWWSCFSVCL